MTEKSAKGPQIPSPSEELLKKGAWMSLSENLALQKMSVPRKEEFFLDITC